MTPIKEHPTLGVLNSPQSVAAAYLLAWQYKDYKRMVKTMQLTYQSKIFRQNWQNMEFEELQNFLTSLVVDKSHETQMTIVARNFNQYTIKSFQIVGELKPSKGVNPRVQRPVIADIDFGSGAKRYKLVCNCETKPFHASPSGIWGVYPTAKLKAA